jgi:hypothetical protein
VLPVSHPTNKLLLANGAALFSPSFKGFVWALGARNMNDGSIETSGETGISHAKQDLCGATIGGATVICQGDIMQECAGPGVALYKPRTCQSHCDGDSVFCYNLDAVTFGRSLSSDLICDRALA